MDKRFRILVVDDEQINIQVLTSVLKDDYDILTAHCGYDAISQIKEHMPDLILLDIIMPDLNGFEVCRRIKADASFADIPVIFMTALNTLDGEFQGLGLGGIDYLAKPINFSLLKLRVRNHLELKQRNELIREQRDVLASQKAELDQLIKKLELQNKRQSEAEEEKQVLQQQLQHAQKLESLGVLAGGIAHDFNNILSIIIGYCWLVKMNYETAQSHIIQIENAADRAAGLCSQMLAYAGKAPLVQTQFDMTELVNEMLKMLKSTIQQNVVIKHEFLPDIPFLKGDANQIRQIVMNLIINASEAIGEEQGEIHVTLEREAIRSDQSEKDHLGKIIPASWYVCLEVTDTGCGMDDETKQRIFEPFYTTKITGRGLGMSAVLGIITAHGGALRISSQPGQGSVFKVYLPDHISDFVDNASPQQVSSVSWRGSGTILLVEDDEAIMSIATAMLDALGFTVIEASNGKEALELYQKNSADISLVFMDMGMPVMDGYELLPELKKLNPKLPIIISSGFGDMIVSSRIVREDIAGFLSKPYSLEHLREVLQSVVDSTSDLPLTLS